MSDEQLPEQTPTRLSEDSAHRLLARAIELDHSGASDTTVAELREAAREAGISAQSFDLALLELASLPLSANARAGRAPLTGSWKMLTGLWQHLRGHSAGLLPIGEVVVSNAIAVALFWVLLSLLTRVANVGAWQAREATILVACAVGVGIARRLRARLVEVGLMGLAAFQAAELAMHLVFGIRAVQGGPTHFAVMIAGILGAAVGLQAGRRPNAAPPLVARSDETSAASMPPDVTAELSPEDTEAPRLHQSMIFRSA